MSLFQSGPTMLLRTTVAILVACTALPASAQEKTTKLNLWVFGEVTEKSVDKDMLKAAQKLGYEIQIREMTEVEFDEAIAEAEKRPSQLPDIVAGFRRPADMPTGFVRCCGFLVGISSGDRVPFVGLIQGSPSHEAAMDLALYKFGRPANYPTAWIYKEPKFPQTGYSKDRKTRLRLMQLARKACRACVRGDRKSLQKLWHPDALSLERKTVPEHEHVKIREVASSNVSYINGNNQIAFVWGLTGISYSTSTPRQSRIIGTVGVLSIWRKLEDEWKLMVVTEDPISEIQIEKIAKLVNQLNDVPSPAPKVELLAPANGTPAKPRQGESFGNYTWQFSGKPFLELAEFDYAHGTRVVANCNGRLSAGELWNTDTQWLWRVWSVARDGSVSFSKVRSFRE